VQKRHNWNAQHCWRRRNRRSRLQAGERLFELERFIDRVPNELLDRGLAPRAKRALPEAAAEAFDAGDPDAARFERVAVQHLRSRLRQNLAHLRGSVRLEVVIAEHGHDGDAHLRQFVGENSGFLRKAGVREVAGDQQQIGRFRGLREERVKGARRGFGAVQVPHCGDAHKVSHGLSNVCLQKLSQGTSPGSLRIRD
jgi:hypothetical protein